MENNLMIFNNEEFGQVRCIKIDDKPYAVANDVAKALGYSRPHDAVTAHCDGAVTYRVTDKLGRLQDTKVIPESDIYSLIFEAAKQSKNPDIKIKAARFKKWVFDEVLPSIRKHGAYISPETLEKMIMSPDFGIKLLTALKEEKDKRIEAENKLIEQQPKIDLYDAVMDDNGLLNFIQVAGIFGECGRNTLMKELRESKILMDGEFTRNVPYSQYLGENGFFEVVVRPRKTKEGMLNIATTLCKTKSLPLIKKVLDKKREKENQFEQAN